MSTAERQQTPVFVRKVRRFWWLDTAPFRRFVIRELTSVFVAVYSVILLLFLLALSRGRAAYEGFLRWLDLPAIVVLHVVILVAVLYHTVTSIQLASQIQEVRLSGKVLPRSFLAGGLTAGWVVASAVVAYLHIWG